MRFRITVRGDHLELRGEIEVFNSNELGLFAQIMEPYGMVIASPAVPSKDADEIVDEILDENYAAEDLGHADGATEAIQHGDLDYDGLRALIKRGIELARKER